jgi:DNA-binding transcriptional MerR regulator
MRIGELADFVGISTRAIRHYHRIGLLPEPARKPNGYREYSLRDAVELARVRRLTELGLSLDEVCDALAGDASRDLVEILRELDADLARQEADLRRRRARLAQLLRQAGAGGKPSEQAPVSAELAGLFDRMADVAAGRPGPEPAMAAKDRDLMALLETAAPALDSGAHGPGWLDVLTRTLNSDPGGPSKGPMRSTRASTSWPTRPRTTPGSRRRPRPSWRPSRSRPGRRSGSLTATSRKPAGVSSRPSTRTSPRPKPPRSAAPST